MYEEQDGEDWGDAMRVNVFDILAVLFRTLTGLFGVVAGMFQGFSVLAQAHSNYADDKHDFQMTVSQGIEMLGGE